MPASAAAAASIHAQPIGRVRSLLLALSTDAARAPTAAGRMTATATATAALAGVATVDEA